MPVNPSSVLCFINELQCEAFLPQILVVSKIDNKTHSLFNYSLIRGFLLMYESCIFISSCGH